MASQLASSPHSSSPPQRETFHPFAHLPAELRLKIWHQVLHITRPTPITITFAPRRSAVSSIEAPPGGDKPQMWEADDTILHRGKPIPVILHVSHESRTVGLERYVMGFDVSEELRALPFNHCWKRVE
ncbi:uncharacterized protein LY89DRAFT_145554 [Mollisia scopiformis]|uniref:2EXR domain-containing protein n=1 Tax=Mollisia scopiformis TaxID=149040 RepID=A0A194X0F8_MOLSC|nr:uncharacterized protein LY89DRAFT_145554 [Mollisia scopiformis]KUJ13686.1 hypothetical protein LY89DRAFT_145554 [Mollisia scopiformis]